MSAQPTARHSITVGTEPPVVAATTAATGLAAPETATMSASGPKRSPPWSTPWSAYETAIGTRPAANRTIERASTCRMRPSRGVAQTMARAVAAPTSRPVRNMPAAFSVDDVFEGAAPAVEASIGEWSTDLRAIRRAATSCNPSAGTAAIVDRFTNAPTAPSEPADR